jgi:hypothetical protein
MLVFLIMQTVGHKLHTNVSLTQVCNKRITDSLFTLWSLAIIVSVNWQSLARKLCALFISSRLKAFLFISCETYALHPLCHLKILKCSKYFCSGHTLMPLSCLQHSCVSVELFPHFTQNLMLTCCAILRFLTVQ